MTDDELDEALKSEVCFHADIYDLIHTLESFDGGGKYNRVANDSLRVIRRLRYEYWELRKTIDAAKEDKQ